MTSSKTQATNEVYLDANGVVRSVYHGRQTAKKLLQTTTRMLEIMNTLITQDKPVRLLVDIRDIGDYDQPARIVEMQSRTALPFWKLAYVTSDDHREGEKMSRLFTAMSARKNQTRYFQREDDALGWLSFMRQTVNN